MRHAKLFGVAMMAMCALGGIAVTMASAALPEFDGPFPKSFHSLGGEGKFETTDKKELQCKSNHVNGEITGPKHGLTKITYLGCGTPSPFGGRVECNTSGQGAGVVLTEKLLSLLGYINKAAKEVGVALEPASAELFAEFVCGGFITVKIKGKVTGKITPVNLLSNSFKLEFKQTAGKPNPAGLEGQTDLLGTSFSGGAFEDSGIERINELILDGGAKGLILA